MTFFNPSNSTTHGHTYKPPSPAPLLLTAPQIFAQASLCIASVELTGGPQALSRGRIKALQALKTPGHSKTKSPIHQPQAKKSRDIQRVVSERHLRTTIERLTEASRNWSTRCEDLKARSLVVEAIAYKSKRSGYQVNSRHEATAELIKLDKKAAELRRHAREAQKAAREALQQIGQLSNAITRAELSDECSDLVDVASRVAGSAASLRQRLGRAKGYFADELQQNKRKQRQKTRAKDKEIRAQRSEKQRPRFRVEQDFVPQKLEVEQDEDTLYSVDLEYTEDDWTEDDELSFESLESEVSRRDEDCLRRKEVVADEDSFGSWEFVKADNSSYIEEDPVYLEDREPSIGSSEEDPYERHEAEWQARQDANTTRLEQIKIEQTPANLYLF